MQGSVFAKMSYEHLANCLLFAFVCVCLRLCPAGGHSLQTWVFANCLCSCLFAIFLGMRRLSAERTGSGSPPKPSYLLSATSRKVSGGGLGLPTRAVAIL